MRAFQRSDLRFYKGYSFDEIVLRDIQRSVEGGKSVSRRKLLNAAINANNDPARGDLNQILVASEIEGGLKAVLRMRTSRVPELYRSTVKTDIKLHPLLGSAMLYGRITDILDGKVEPTKDAPLSRLRTPLVEGRDRHRGLVHAIIPLEEDGDPNEAKTYFLEHKLPGRRAQLFGPYPMPEAGLPVGRRPVRAFDVVQDSKTHAIYNFTLASLPHNWVRSLDKIEIDRKKHFVTIPFRVYRSSHPNGPSERSSEKHHGGTLALERSGPWGIQILDVLNNKRLKYAQLTMDP